MSKTVMFIHGAWLTPASFDLFRTRYEGQGYTCVAPAWPYDDRPIAELRRSSPPELAKLSIAQIVDHYAKAIQALPEEPILIGHSFGGLIVQLLLDRGLGAAGVAISPAPPRGVLAHPLAVWTSRSVFLSWNGWNRVLPMSQKGFNEGFGNLLSPAEQRAAYERHVIPTPGRIFFQAALGLGTGVNFGNADRAPLLLTAAEKDRTVPLPMVRANFKKYRRPSAVTAFKTFPNHSHWLIQEPEWHEVADYAIQWARSNDRMSGHPQPEARRRPARPDFTEAQPPDARA
jgi:pimeloyl-ACP methyl ester carboxylesterase